MLVPFIQGGCNQGTCHGSKDGRNGFKLSLRGYDALYDIRAFTDDIKSRRVNVASYKVSCSLGYWIRSTRRPASLQAWIKILRYHTPVD